MRREARGQCKPESPGSIAAGQATPAEKWCDRLCKQSTGQQGELPATKGRTREGQREGQHPDRDYQAFVQHQEEKGQRNLKG